EYLGSRGTMYQLLIPNDAVDAIKNTPGVISVQPMLYPPNVTGTPADWAFPQDTVNFKWNRDNFGPLTIPAMGTTITLTTENIALYRRVIANYEGNTLQETGNQFIINGQATTTYTFKQDYY